MVADVVPMRDDPPIEAYAADDVPRGTLKPLDPLQVVSMADFATIEPPEVRFVAAPILPREHVTLLGGHGEAGKSYLALVFAAHVAVGRKFGDLQFAIGRSLVISLEDSADLAKLRLRRVCEAYEIDPEDVAKSTTLVDGGDNDETALAFELNQHGVRRLQLTRAFEQVKEFAAGHDLIIIDNTSDAYDADEIMRRMVRQFIRALARIGKQHSAAVLLLAHIDKAGARNGTQGETYSGSTSWHNTVRSRLAILRSDLGTELVHEKSNLAKKLERPILLLRNDFGVPMPVTADEREKAETQDHRAVFEAIKGCIKDGVTVPCAATGPVTAHSILCGRANFPEAMIADKRRFKAAMLTLERESVIWKEDYRNADHKVRQRWTSAS